jgi:pyrroline-5-carboxylate reductase
MGRALLAGWIASGIAPAAIRVIEPDSSHRRQVPAGIETTPDLTEPSLAVAAVVLAVKPQALAAVAPLYSHYAGGGTLILSIAAGRTLAALAGWLGNGAPIVRAMPNTPAAVGRGMTVACANPAVAPDQRRLADQLLAAVGAVEWVDDEVLLDAVTALSGSGPAYVFFLAECLAEAGVAAGLPAGLAERLARATVAGAGELLHRSTAPATELRHQVTSPGGTTAAALERLMAGDALQSLLTEAVQRATLRARELAG